MVPVLHEGYVPFHIQGRGPDIETHGNRDVLEVIRDVELAYADVEGGLEGILEQLRPPDERKSGAVDGCLENRLDEGIHLIGEIGKQRDVDPDFSDRVPGLLRNVVEIDASIADLDIVQGETERFRCRCLSVAGRRSLPGSKLLDQIGKIIFPVRVPDDVHIRGFQADLPEDHAKPEERDDLEISIQRPEGDERLFLVPLPDREVAHVHREGKRIHIDLFNPDFPVERFR